ncbi:MAG: CinA family protein [Chloroflexota bacterium]|nr:MAG: CinA family protein [Chloroflexota bacterium]
MADTELLALAERLQGLCLGRGLTVATAESCTGGLLASIITDVPGSSGYFRGSVVAYADATKVALLDVPEATLEAHGAVSAQTARAMAIGIRARLDVSMAVSVTGISGPDGGSDEKPVGLTYIGLADGGTSDVRRYTWTGDRAANRHDSARAALRWLIERAETPPPGEGP